jgi:hypothetical protein
MGRLIESGVTDETTCKIQSTGDFDFLSPLTPNVRAQFLGRDGNILILDKPITPLQHPLMRYPSGSLLDYIFSAPNLIQFSNALVVTGAWAARGGHERT